MSIAVDQDILASDYDGIKMFKGYAADAGGSDDYAITVSPVPAAYVAGDTYIFKANTANTGAATLNVNTLGQIAIKKNYNQALETGDIMAGQLVAVVFDGTNFQLLSPATRRFNSGAATRDISAANSTQTIAHGLSNVPRVVRIRGANTNGTAVGGVAFAVWTASGGGKGVTFTSFEGGTVADADLIDTPSGILVRSNKSPSSDDFVLGTISVDATNINIAWVKNNSPVGTFSFVWETEA